MLAVVLRGLAQVVFSDRPAVGLLVVAATAAVAPWSALAAVAGAVAGTAAGRVFRTSDDASWRAGLSAYNPAVVGISWGGVLARQEASAGLFPLALGAAIALDAPLRRASARLGLPPLSAAAVLTVWLSFWVFRAFGQDLWAYPGLLPWGEAGVAAAIVLVAASTLWTAPRAALTTTALVAASVAVWRWGLGEPGLGPAGLWAFTVAPAAFGTSAVFLRDSRLGLLAGGAAALLGAGLWIAWVVSGAAGVLPPVLAPFVLGVWVVLWGVARRWGAEALDPALGLAAGLVRRARRRRAPAVVLTGAGVSTASGIPDYVSGAWLDPEVPVADYAHDRFLASRACREAYWNACHRFRRHTVAARPNPAHRALAELERRGAVAAVVTQNVDGLHQAAGSRAVVELHGNIEGLRCLGCGLRYAWPRDEVWLAGDPLCGACGSWLKPAVIALGEDLPLDAWAAADEAVARCGLLLVVGTQVAISSAAALLAAARRRGARVVFVNTGPVLAPVGPDDLFLRIPAERTLPALALLLDCPTDTRGESRWPR